LGERRAGSAKVAGSSPAGSIEVADWVARGTLAGMADPSGEEPAERAVGARLLIVTGAAVAGVEELPALVRSLIASASEILVVTPVLPGRLQWLASDTDRVRHEADERLQSVMSHVEQLAPEGAVSGGAGDETPLSAFADAVRRFRPDHILVALRASDHSAWQERQLVDRVRAAFHIPLTIFEIDRAGHVPSPGSNAS
jgi:hypothetical protein